MKIDDYILILNLDMSNEYFQFSISSEEDLEMCANSIAKYLKTKEYSEPISFYSETKDKIFTLPAKVNTIDNPIKISYKYKHVFKVLLKLIKSIQKHYDNIN